MGTSVIKKQNAPFLKTTHPENVWDGLDVFETNTFDDYKLAKILFVKNRNFVSWKENEVAGFVVFSQ